MRRPDARAMARLLAEQTQTAAGLILRLAWRQGLTREEIQRLTWNDVDFSAHQLRLPDRTIPLEAETEDCLGCVTLYGAELEKTLAWYAGTAMPVALELAPDGESFFVLCLA